MDFNTIFTLAVVAIIVAALALYLIEIASNLNHVSFTVGTVLVGVRSIAAQTEPLAPVVRDLVSNISAIDSELEALVSQGESVEKAPSGGLPTGTKMYGPNLRGW